MGGAEYDIIVEAVRVLLLVGVPLVILLGVAGTLVGALQAATTIQDSALSYAAKLLMLVLVIYLLLPMAVKLVTALAETAFS